MFCIRFRARSRSGDCSRQGLECGPLPRPGLFFLHDAGGRHARGFQSTELQGERLILAGCLPHSPPCQQRNYPFQLIQRFYVQPHAPCLPVKRHLHPQSQPRR